MKQLLILLLFSTAIMACKSNFTSQGQAEKAFVERYLRATKDWAEPLKLSEWINPADITSQGLTDYNVNRYAPEDFKFMSYDAKTGSLVYQIWGADRNWVHELTFQLVKANGKLYFKAGKLNRDVNYVDPWTSARTYIE
jgi:hypothetical protein